MVLKSFLILVLTFSVVFALDLQILQEKSDSLDKKFLSGIISKTKVYDDISKIPNTLKEGDTVITEDDYGVKNFYILNSKKEMEEFVSPFFNDILNSDSVSTFSNMFVPSGMIGKEYSSTADSKSFTEYVGNVATIRIEVVKVPSRVDHMEQALNDYLLNKDIDPSSVVNIQLVTEENNKNLWIFYRP